MCYRVMVFMGMCVEAMCVVHVVCKVYELSG